MVGKTGIALIVFYGILALFLIVPFIICVKDHSDGLAGVFALTFLCQRFLWIILGSIVLSSLSKMREALNENIDLADEYDIINECADEYSRVDADALIGAQEDELNKIAPMFNMSWTLFAYIFFECFIAGCLVCCNNCGNNSPSCDCNNL